MTGHFQFPLTAGGRAPRPSAPCVRCLVLNHRTANGKPLPGLFYIFAEGREQAPFSMGIYLENVKLSCTSVVRNTSPMEQESNETKRGKKMSGRKNNILKEA